VNISAALESAIDSAFRYGHGWPAVFGAIVLAVLYVLTIVRALNMVEDVRRTRALRKEMRDFERAREARIAETLRNVSVVDEATQRQVLDAIASISSQPVRVLPHKRTIQIQVFLVLLALSAATCAATSSWTPRQPNAGEARADVSAMTFVRHANGLCFGVVRFTTYANYQGVSITHVPSEACR
jgi:hypothetical protein